MVALLTALAVVLFVGVTALSRVYHTQQDALGERWFRRGRADLQRQQFDPAVVEFRGALLYSRDNYQYQMNLAEALLGLKRTSEASAYLINLWEREPENGTVNLELARVAAGRGETGDALRYYHNAVYATWPGDEESERRVSRLELIEYLLKINARAQAQSELIALEANVGTDAAEQARVGDLFVRTQDYEHALAAYRASLSVDRHNPAARAGAGRAAYELGNFELAERYLQGAVTANPGDADSMARLKTTELALQVDPFQRRITAAQRSRLVIRDFAAAGDRLKACGALQGFAAGTNSIGSLQNEWNRMRPQMTETGLRHTPEAAEAAMDLTFNIERQANVLCGSPQGMDLALLLIARKHEGN